MGYQRDSMSFGSKLFASSIAVFRYRDALHQKGRNYSKVGRLDIRLKAANAMEFMDLLIPARGLADPDLKYGSNQVFCGAAKSKWRSS